MKNLKTLILSKEGLRLSVCSTVLFYVVNIVVILFISSTPIWGVLGMTGMMATMLICLWQQGEING